MSRLKEPDLVLSLGTLVFLLCLLGAFMWAGLA
jgi:hypothetical protein